MCILAGNAREIPSPNSLGVNMIIGIRGFFMQITLSSQLSLNPWGI
jgi:hypothetical protein